MISGHHSDLRLPNEPVRPECCHKATEDCLPCVACGHCRESLDVDDLCSECRATLQDARSLLAQRQRP
jgi:hypothetical protein